MCQAIYTTEPNSHDKHNAFLKLRVLLIKSTTNFTYIYQTIGILSSMHLHFDSPDRFVISFRSQSLALPLRFETIYIYVSSMHVGLVYPYGISNFINKIMGIEISAGQLTTLRASYLLSAEISTISTCTFASIHYLNISYAELFLFRIYEYKIHSF